MKAYVARQPIFNSRKHVVAYELLYRESEKNFFPVGIDPTKATSKVIVNYFLDTKIEDITEQKPALVNFNLQSLKLIQNLIPSKEIIIEILETEEPSDELFDIVRDMFHKNYVFALDDFVYNEQWLRFVPFVRLIKFDIQRTPLDTIQPIIDKIKQKKQSVKILAEKVETYEEFQKAKELNFDFYQGYFFSKPEMLVNSTLPASYPMLMSLYKECLNENINIKKITDIFQRDVSLSYKLFNYINNPCIFTLKNTINTIKDAVIYMGEIKLKQFVFLIVTAELSYQKPPALIALATHRAKFCEILAQNSYLHNLSDKAFLIGLFSVLDAILDRDMNHILKDLNLESDMKKALINKIGIYSAFLKIAISYENADWDTVELLCEQIDIPKEKIQEFYTKAINWEHTHLEALQ